MERTVTSEGSFYYHGLDSYSGNLLDAEEELKVTEQIPRYCWLARDRPSGPRNE